jgi:uncharacterized protein (TIGR02453 family)
MPKKAARPATFEGFRKDAPQFWHELAAEMNRGWFADNKDRYQQLWVEPMTALLGDVAARLATSYKGHVLAPKVMRIQRDIRFAKDKSPYKTHIGGVIMVGGTKLGENTAALYVHMGVDEEFVGIGCHMFDSTQLASWRKQVADKDGDKLVKIVDKLRGQGYVIEGTEPLVRVPKPYVAEHPRGDYIKMKGITGLFPAIPKGKVFEPELVDWMTEHATATAPLVRWLHEHV